jgi:hypothetical protein
LQHRHPPPPGSPFARTGQPVPAAPGFFFVEDLVDMAVGVIGIAAQIGDILLLIILVTDSDCAVSNRRMGCPGRIIMRPMPIIEIAPA